jgi:hypothetical protein
MELMHESTETPCQFDEGWIARFMGRLQQENPTLADEVIKAANERLKEVE